jgi:hypothetical protein
MLPPMPPARWRPASEAEAVGAVATFIEWCQAVRGLPVENPVALAFWRADAPAAFHAAIADFFELGDHPSVRAALLAGNDDRPALITPSATAGDRVWTRGELLAARALPQPLETMLAMLTPADLPALAASHLLDAGTAPDDCLEIEPDASDPWPLGGWLLGASLRLAD